MNTQRLEWVDAAKGISIILVVISHSSYWLNQIGLGLTSSAEVNVALSEMRMPLFFLVSGLFAGKYMLAPWRLLLTKKIALLIWVFVVWQIIGIAYSVLAGLTIHDAPSGEVLPRAFLKPLISIIRPSNELWFLWALALMFMVLRSAWRLDKAALLLLTLVPLIAVAATPPQIEELLAKTVSVGWLGIAQYTFVFTLGASMGKSGARKIALMPNIAALPLLLIFGSFMMLSPHLDLRAGNILFMFSGIISGICLARLLSNVRWLRHVGQKTLPIYVSHTFIIVLITALIDRMSLDLGGNARSILLLCVTCGALLIALSVHNLASSGGLRYLYEKPPMLQKLLDKKFGLWLRKT